jgi:hypothetical protein
MRAAFCFAMSGTISLGTAACGSASESDGASGPNGSTFLAFGSTFDDFHAWSSYPVPAGTGVGSVHTSGPRTEYVNHLPTSGSTSFPMGTIIVKETDGGVLADRSIFAMVKRGGSYNAAGAKDWEWFELQNVDEHSVRVLWRGVGPPAGEKYGGDPNGGCNGCHTAAKSNDYVQSKALQLDDF